jgi:PAS domain S-box-containing protein
MQETVLQSILVFQIKLDTLLAWTQEIDADEGGYLYIVDQHGQLAAHPRRNVQEEIVDYSEYGPIQDVLSGTQGAEVGTLENNEHVIAYSPVTNFGWGVLVTQPSAVAFAERDELLRAVAIAYIVVVLAVALMVFSVITAFVEIRRRALQLAEQMTESLQESKKLYQTLVETTPDAIVLADLEATVQVVNNQAVEMYGYPKDQVIGASAFNFIAPEDHERTRSALQELITQGQVYNFEFTSIRADHSRFVSRANASLFMDSTGKPAGFITVIHDVTEAKNLEQAKDEFIAVAAHELRTPLSTIQWYAKRVLSSEETKSPNLFKYISEIQHATDRILGLVNHLLDVSRIALGRLSLEAHDFPLKELLQSVITEFDAQFKERSLGYQTEFPERDVTVTADPKYMRIVLRNLVANAIKYTPSGGQIEFALTINPDNVIVRITDTGYGIPRHQHEKIFSRMFRADNAKQQHPEGLGLGLYMAKAIIEESGGSIWFESEINQGTSFYVLLPLSKKAD